MIHKQKHPGQQPSDCQKYQKLNQDSFTDCLCTGREPERKSVQCCHICNLLLQVMQCFSKGISILTSLPILHTPPKDKQHMACDRKRFKYRKEQKASNTCLLWFALLLPGQDKENIPKAMAFKLHTTPICFCRVSLVVLFYI